MASKHQRSDKRRGAGREEGGALKLQVWSRRFIALIALVIPSAGLFGTPYAHADNVRLNNSVFANIYTAQKQGGCQWEPHQDRRLIEAARVHTIDVRDYHEINGDTGSDGSTPQDRARAAGFVGGVSETVAINPALAISGIEILNQWWYDPASRATMQDCRNTAVGVWSESSLDRTVVVAVYGQPV
jgi:hypothetical protein